MYVHVYSHYICNVQSLLLMFCCKIYKYSNMNMTNTHLEEIMMISWYPLIVVRVQSRKWIERAYGYYIFIWRKILNLYIQMYRFHRYFFSYFRFDLYEISCQVYEWAMVLRWPFRPVGLSFKNVMSLKYINCVFTFNDLK